jgi:hypothetical protein
MNQAVIPVSEKDIMDAPNGIIDLVSKKHLVQVPGHPGFYDAAKCFNACTNHAASKFKERKAASPGAAFKDLMTRMQAGSPGNLVFQILDDNRV